MNGPAIRTHASRGFTLVELMVAMVLGLLLTAAITSLFIANKRNYRRNDLVATMQDNARFAMQALADDLAVAGFQGGIIDRAGIQIITTQTSTLTTDCGPGADGIAGWGLDTTALGFVNAAAGASIGSTFGCLGTANLADGNDVVSVHHASALTGVLDNDAATPALTLETSTFYLRSNRTTGELFYSGATGGDAPGAQAPLWYWRYGSHLYFVRPYSQSAGDHIPTLCRVYIDHDSSTIATETVAEGVEVLQIAFGIDSDNDGVANRYSSAPTTAQLADAVTARITLLARSIQADPSYVNDKSYDLVGYDDDHDGSVDEANEAYTPNDHFYRRVLQTTVVLHNVVFAL